MNLSDIASGAIVLLDKMKDASAVASHGDHREREAWKRYDEAERELRALFTVVNGSATHGVSRIAPQVEAPDSSACEKKAQPTP